MLQQRCHVDFGAGVGFESLRVGGGGSGISKRRRVALTNSRSGHKQVNGRGTDMRAAVV